MQFYALKSRSLQLFLAYRQWIRPIAYLLPVILRPL